MNNIFSWRRARQITQVTSVVLFFILAWMTFRGSESAIPVDLYFRFNPFVAFAAMLASRAVITTVLLAALAIVFGFIFGRAWCGWLCPLGAMLDWFSPNKPGKIELHAPWLGGKYVLLIAAFIAALLGNPSLLILDPITIFNRALAGAFMPGLNVILGAVESALYPNVLWLQLPLDQMEQSFRDTVLLSQQTYYQLGWLLALVFVALIGLNWVASRFWCRYLCPLGAVYALQAKIALLRPRIVNDCNHCAGLRDVRFCNMI